MLKLAADPGTGYTGYDKACPAFSSLVHLHSFSAITYFHQLVLCQIPS
jgi:hypothetical protein